MRVGWRRREEVWSWVASAKRRMGSGSCRRGTWGGAGAGVGAAVVGKGAAGTGTGMRVGIELVGPTRRARFEGEVWSIEEGGEWMVEGPGGGGGT